jgi:predicted permease
VFEFSVVNDNPFVQMTVFVTFIFIFIFNSFLVKHKLIQKEINVVNWFLFIFLCVIIGNSNANSTTQGAIKA